MDAPTNIRVIESIVFVESSIFKAYLLVHSIMLARPRSNTLKPISALQIEMFSAVPMYIRRSIQMRCVVNYIMYRQLLNTYLIHDLLT